MCQASSGVVILSASCDVESSRQGNNAGVVGRSLEPTADSPRTLPLKQRKTFGWHGLTWYIIKEMENSSEKSRKCISKCSVWKGLLGLGGSSASCPPLFLCVGTLPRVQIQQRHPSFGGTRPGLVLRDTSEHNRTVNVSRSDTIGSNGNNRRSSNTLRKRRRRAMPALRHHGYEAK